MRPRQNERGAALPETAMVLVSLLAIIFGIVQIGIIGFLQIMVDGAAFVAAHEYALHNSAFRQVAQRPFPQAGTIQIDTNSPDVTSVPVNFQTNLTTQRRGGVSLIRGSHLQATAIAFSPGGLFGALSNIAVHGSAIEPMNQVSNDIYDVGGAGYSGASAQTAFANDPQNTPYNYVSQHEFTICTGGFNTVHIQGCSSAYQVRSLGTAEFLDHDNWQRTTLGVGPYSLNYTFAEMLCHQQKYAKAVQTIFVPFDPTNPNYPQGSLPTPDPNDIRNVVGQIYSWDVVSSNGGGYGLTETSYGLYPMHPENYC